MFALLFCLISSVAILGFALALKWDIAQPRMPFRAGHFRAETLELVLEQPLAHSKVPVMP
jgi:hypothetical protein